MEGSLSFGLSPFWDFSPFSWDVENVVDFWESSFLPPYLVIWGEEGRGAGSLFCSSYPSYLAHVMLTKPLDFQAKLIACLWVGCDG